MKKGLHLFLGLIVSLTVLSMSPTATTAKAAYNANDIDVTIGEKAVGHMESGTSDLFLFAPDKCGELTITIKCDIEDSVTASLYSDYNEDNPMLGGAVYDSWEECTTIKYHVCVSPRTYYLKLTNPTSIKSGEITVASELIALQSDEATAENNVRLNAITLKNNHFYHGVLAFDEEEDYYFIHLNKETLVKFTVSSDKEESTDVILKDYRGEVIDQGDIYGDRTYTYKKKLPEGKYYLVINRGSLKEQMGKTYTIVTGNFLMITKITIPKSKTLKVGDTFVIKPEIIPKKATEEYTYSSSNSKVAKVTSSGKVIALKKGTARITLLTEDGKLKRFCRITVQ